MPIPYTKGDTVYQWSPTWIDHVMPGEIKSNRDENGYYLILNYHTLHEAVHESELYPTESDALAARSAHLDRKKQQLRAQLTSPEDIVTYLWNTMYIDNYSTEDRETIQEQIKTHFGIDVEIE